MVWEKPPIAGGNQTSLTFDIDVEVYSLRQSTYHLSVWFVVKASCALAARHSMLASRQRLVRRFCFWRARTHCCVPCICGRFLGCWSRDVLHPLLNRLLHVWKGSNPDFLGREPGDVDTMHLGLKIELGPEEGTWLVHQQSYIRAFLQEMFDPECLKDRHTPGEPESFSHKLWQATWSRTCTESTSETSITSRRTRSTSANTDPTPCWSVTMDLFADKTRHCMGCCTHHMTCFCR